MMYRTHNRAAGFTLTEMAIVLGVVGVLVAGLWNLISGANQQARDESAASQQSQLITAVKGFLFSQQGQSYMKSNSISVAAGGCNGTCGTGSSFSLPLPTTTACTDFLDANWIAFCSFLPPGFVSTTVNSYGQIYRIRILRDGTPNPDAFGNLQAPNSYSFMVLTDPTGAQVIPDTSGARISALLGGDGGFVYSNQVCSSAANVAITACGSYGGWTVQTTGAGPGFGFAVANSHSGAVASRSYMSPQQNALSDWLARIQMPGDSTFNLNTMNVSEYLGGWPLVMGSYNGTIATQVIPIGTAPGDIYMGNYGLATGGGNLNVAAGKINMETGTLNFVGGGTLTGVVNLDTANPVKIQSPDPSVSQTSGLIIDGNMVGLNAAGPNYQTPNAALTLLGHCTRTAPANNPTNSPPSFVVDGSGNSQCQYTASITGDVNVLGLLNSYNLFAGSFIYRGSDIRLKTDIHPINNPLVDVMKLKPVSYRLKADNQESLGVIAQDLEKVYPQLVTVNGGTKYVDYEGLIGPLIGAVQELKKQNDQLQHEIDTLKKQQKKAD